MEIYPELFATAFAPRCALSLVRSFSATITVSREFSQLGTQKDENRVYQADWRFVPSPFSFEVDLDSIGEQERERQCEVHHINWTYK